MVFVQMYPRAVGKRWGFNPISYQWDIRNNNSGARFRAGRIFLGRMEFPGRGILSPREIGEDHPRSVGRRWGFHPQSFYNDIRGL
jgi:hypothetical protein